MIFEVGAVLLLLAVDAKADEGRVDISSEDAGHFDKIAHRDPLRRLGWELNSSPSESPIGSTIPTIDVYPQGSSDARGKKEKHISGSSDDSSNESDSKLSTKSSKGKKNSRSKKRGKKKKGKKSGRKSGKKGDEEKGTPAPSAFATASAYPTLTSKSPEPSRSPAPVPLASVQPSTGLATASPSLIPTNSIGVPTGTPTATPTTAPTSQPTSLAEGQPTQQPQTDASSTPSQPAGSDIPSSSPSVGSEASNTPSGIPSDSPSVTSNGGDTSETPSLAPSQTPSQTPSEAMGMEGGGGNFNIDLDTSLVADANYVPAFTAAAARWSEVIVGDLEDYMFSQAEIADSACPNLPEFVDDIHICAVVTAIDGPSGILGSAGPEYARFGDNIIPVAGNMMFDSADVENLLQEGSLNGVILHEMGHVFGIGTLWDLNGLMGADMCSYNTGTKASDEYQALSGCTVAVPLENDGGAGTACGHWEEDCYVDELMTGFSTGNLALSRTTVASLEDIGYVVDYNAADPFPVDSLGTSCVCTNVKEKGKLVDVTTITALSGHSAEGNSQQFSGTGVLDEQNVGGRDSAKQNSAGTGRQRQKRTKKEGKNKIKNSRGPFGKHFRKIEKKRRRKKPHRRLSDEGKKVAFNFGKSLLREREAIQQKRKIDDGLLYVGHLITSVLYIENGEIYSVEVKHGD